MENTIPALQALIRRDNAGAADHFSYVEFDVHVSLCAFNMIAACQEQAAVIQSQLELLHPTCFTMSHALETHCWQGHSIDTTKGTGTLHRHPVVPPGHEQLELQLDGASAKHGKLQRLRHAAPMSHMFAEN